MYSRRSLGRQQTGSTAEAFTHCRSSCEHRNKATTENSEHPQPPIHLCVRVSARTNTCNINPNPRVCCLIIEHRSGVKTVLPKDSLSQKVLPENCRPKGILAQKFGIFFSYFTWFSQTIPSTTPNLKVLICLFLLN